MKMESLSFSRIYLGKMVTFVSHENTRIFGKFMLYKTNLFFILFFDNRQGKCHFCSPPFSLETSRTTKGQEYNTALSASAPVQLFQSKEIRWIVVGAPKTTNCLLTDSLLLIIQYNMYKTRLLRLSQYFNIFCTGS